MRITRRVGAVLSGLAMAGAVSSGTAVATAGADQSVTSERAAVVVKKTDPSQGFCDQSEDGLVKLGGDGHLYECKYIWGLGWYWMPA